MANSTSTTPDVRPFRRQPALCRQSAPRARMLQAYMVAMHEGWELAMFGQTNCVADVTVETSAMSTGLGSLLPSWRCCAEADWIVRACCEARVVIFGSRKYSTRSRASTIVFRPNKSTMYRRDTRKYSIQSHATTIAYRPKKRTVYR